MSTRTDIFDHSRHLSTGQMLSYLRRQLSRDEAHEVERHLTDCELCSDALEGLKNLNSESSMLRISDELHRMARRRRPKAPKLFSRFDLITLFAMVFLVLFLIAVAILFFRNGV